MGSISVYPGIPPLASQDLEVYDSTGAELGTVYASMYGSDILGIDSAQFTVQDLVPTADDIEAALTDSDIDFSGASFTAADLATALTGASFAGPYIPYGSGDIIGGNVLGAIVNSDIGVAQFFQSGISQNDVAEVLNTADLGLSDLPDTGTVYSITNLGGGFANVYEAVPNADGTAATSITDTLVTPWGNFDIPTEYDAIANVNPANAFEGFAATSDNVSDNAFTLDGLTFDPGSDGFTAVPALVGIAPLLGLGGGQVSPGAEGWIQDQTLGVYDSSGADLGSVVTGWNYQNLLGIDSTQLTVTSVAPPTDSIETALADSSGISFSGNADFDDSDLASALINNGLDFSDGDITGDDIIDTLAGTDIGAALGISVFGGFNPDNVADGITFTPDAAATALNGIDADLAGLPATGTVYSVTDFGSGFANVYVATPNADGTAAASISDTLVTPWGSIDIPTEYDAIAPMDPGAAFAGLGDAGDLGSDNAFTIGGITFDPGSDGFDPVYPLSGNAPLLQIGGGQIAGSFFATQDLDVYGGSDSEPVSVETTVNTSNLLGLFDSTQFTVSEYDVPAAEYASALDDSDISFANADFTAGDLVGYLEDRNDIVSGVNLGSGDLTGDDVTTLLGFTSPYDLSAAGIDPADVAAVLNSTVADYSDGLPDVGSVYSVTDFGLGFSNVYVATPDDTGDAAGNIQDFLVTPFGNVDLSSMFGGFDAIAGFDPGDAVAGVTTAGDTAADAAAGAFDLFDPSTWF